MPQFQLSDEDATQAVTLRQAIAHTTGLPNTDPVVGYSGLPPEGFVEYLADVTIDASGSSDVDLTDFPVADADINASGSSTVTVNPGGRLDVDASGSS